MGAKHLGLLFPLPPCCLQRLLRLEAVQGRHWKNSSTPSALYSWGHPHEPSQTWRLKALGIFSPSSGGQKSGISVTGLTSNAGKAASLPGALGASSQGLFPRPVPVTAPWLVSGSLHSARGHVVCLSTEAHSCLKSSPTGDSACSALLSPGMV